MCSIQRVCEVVGLSRQPCETANGLCANVLVRICSRHFGKNSRSVDTRHCRAPDARLRILAGKRVQRFGFVGTDLIHGGRPDCRVRVLPSGLRPELFKNAHAHWTGSKDVSRYTPRPRTTPLRDLPRPVPPF